MLKSPSNFSPWGITRVAARTLTYLFADDGPTEVIFDLPLQDREWFAPLHLNAVNDSDHYYFHKVSRTIGRSIQYFPSLKDLLERGYSEQLSQIGTFYPNVGSTQQYLEHKGIFAFVPKIDIIFRAQNGDSYTLEKGSIVTPCLDTYSLEKIVQLFDPRIGMVPINDALDAEQ